MWRIVASDVDHVCTSGIKKNSSTLDEGWGRPERSSCSSPSIGRTNTDDVQRLNAIFGALMELRQRTKMPVVLPVHPRTQQRMNDLWIHPGPGRRATIRARASYHPSDTLDMLELERNARVGDHGQRRGTEGSLVLRETVWILRSETEWVELVEQGHGELWMRSGAAFRC
ncbi:MAG: UDP-N-acetylglucosamine 2-epimerase [Flavobacteriales bacterium]|nr:UDP-N-acetylglucosamine 2-epimerase [Flavobacteriales bacterium]